jgi:hypothetical protein
MRVCVKETSGSVLKMCYVNTGEDFVISSAEKLRFN